MIIFYRHFSIECYCSFCLLKQELIKGLKQEGINIKLKQWNIDWDSWYPVSIHFNMALCYKGKMLGEFFFESNKMPEKIVEFAEKYFDVILCSSKFIKEAWINSGIDKRLIHNSSWIWPIPDYLRFKGNRWYSSDKIQFLMVGNWQHDPSWQDRKGLQQVYDLWCEVDRKDATLIIKTDKYAPSDLEKDNITVIRDKLSKIEIAQLYSSCQYYISAHKGEGFGRTVLEALYYGCNVGATGYSGVLDFLNEENATLFNYDLINHEIYPKEFYADNQFPKFAQPKAEDIKKFILNPTQRKARFANKFLLQNSVKRLLWNIHTSFR